MKPPAIPTATEELCYEFEGYRLERRRNRLTRIADRLPVMLPPRVLDVLTYLIERPGELITRESLIDALWPRTAVEENSLDRSIFLLRRGLGEGPREHRFVATVRGRGYRFVATVTRASLPDHGTAANETPAVRDSEARQLYQQAQALLLRPNEENVRATIELLAVATRRSPDFARAWALLSVAHVLCMIWEYVVPDPVASAERASQRSLALDPRDGTSHTAVGLVHALRGEWCEAERHLSAADTLPNDPYFMGLRLHVTWAAGHIRESARQLHQVHLSALAEPFAAQMLAFAHQTLGDDAATRKYLELAITLGAPPAVAPHPDMVAQLALRERRYEDAAKLMGECVRLEQRGADALHAVELVHSALGFAAGRREAASELHKLEIRLRKDGLDPVIRNRLLLWYSQLGAVDFAHDLAEWCLDRYVAQGTVGCVWFVIWMPEMRDFRRHARFRRFVSRMNLPEYWREYGPAEA